MVKIELKAVLGKHSDNYFNSLATEREEYSLVKGVDALKAMQETWNLAVDFCKANAELSKEESYRYSREHKKQISFFPIDKKSIEKVKEMIL